MMSMVNSSLATIEDFFSHKAVINTELPDDPVFIIGHPRTGTTLLHNILAKDYHNFYFCTTFCAGFPSSFLWFEKWGKILFRGVMERTRPMDNMKLHFDLPQEEEIATNLLSGGYSYYMMLWFMKQETQLRRYLSFEEREREEEGEKREREKDEERW
eukprot:CAMPEP_0182422776 /NCGR_PEP_ID=MMETSP1167-20130531/8541_1 /TAXON_ID=2988 /ORGANISM="Mallomonas Sp, Strain CCMP3275" /LENGTH=156 /DNA_ID=CAMNT_0024601117 /DNA_START=265 /DNA_END=732 /DNA_ORIENTATION=-